MEVIYELSVGNKNGDLEWPWMVQWPLYCIISLNLVNLRSNTWPLPHARQKVHVHYLICWWASCDNNCSSSNKIIIIIFMSFLACKVVFILCSLQRFYSSQPWHIQEDVGVKERVRKWRTEGYPPQDFLSRLSCSPELCKYNSYILCGCLLSAVHVYMYWSDAAFNVWHISMSLDAFLCLGWVVCCYFCFVYVLARCVDLCVYVCDLIPTWVRVRPIPVSGIGRYSPVTVGIGIGQYLFEYRRRYQ